MIYMYKIIGEYNTDCNTKHSRNYKTIFKILYVGPNLHCKNTMAVCLCFHRGLSSMCEHSSLQNLGFYWLWL